MNIGSMRIGGGVRAKVIPAKKAPFSWRVRNALRFTFLWGLLCNWLAEVFTALTGIPTITAELAIRKVHADGKVTNYGIVSRRVVTSAGVGFLVDDWDSDAVDITTMNFHACGTGVNAEAAGDVALQTEATTITDRVAGTKSQPAANQLRTIGTQAFTGAGQITEHGVLSSITEGAGVLWDRSVFTAIPVGSGDSIQWQYTCTLNAGG